MEASSAEILKQLLDAEANVDLVDKNGVSTLMMAV